MEATRLAPELVRGKTIGEQYLYVVVITALIMLNGIFNYTATTIVFYATALLAGGAVLLLLFRERYRACLTVCGAASLGVFAWCVLECMSGIWAVDTSKAFLALLGYSSAFFVFIGAKAFTGARPDGATPILRVIGYCGAALSLISIEMASTGLIYRLINSTFAATLGNAGLSITYGAWVEGARMESIMGLPNIFATFSAACFIALLGIAARTDDKRITYALMLAMAACGTGFFLTNSRGGMLALCAALAVYVLFAPKGGRAAAALDAALAALCCGAASVVMGLLMTRMPAAVLPALCLAALALHLVWMVRGRMLDRLRGMNIRAVIAIAGAAALVGAGYIIAGLNIHAPYTLTPGGGFMERALYLSPGPYQVRIEADMPEDTALSLMVESASIEQASRQTGEQLGDFELLYGAPDNTYAFTVPDGAAVVRFSAVAWGHDVTVNAVTVYGADGAAAARVPTRYALLPEALMSRLQGIWADANVLQRMVYWRDGLRIFLKSPLYGSGGNSFEVLSPAVADAYYFTRHPHNHFIQVMLETGLLGLAAMLTACAGIARLLWKRRAREDGGSGVVQTLAAAIGMFIIHSLTEASLQNQLNMQLFFLLLGIAAGFCADGARARRTAREAGRAAVLVYVTLMIALLGGHVYTQRAVAAGTRQGTGAMYEAYRAATVTDPYNADTYRSTAMSLYTMSPDPAAKALVYAFAEDVGRGEDNPANCIKAGLFFMNEGDMALAAYYYERSIMLRPADPHAWDEVLALYYRPLCTDAAASNPAVAAMLPEIKDSALRIAAMLRQYNQNAPVGVAPNAKLMDGIKVAEGTAGD